MSAPERIPNEPKDPLEGKPFSQAFRAQKERWYSKIPLNLRQMDAIIWITGIALGIVIVLIVLEAAGIFKL
ncbi:MAG: hypothetical protein IJ074_10295 [Clostridia bacterium]|nr:hypothetical protein [Clostridia bacterium]MBQ8973452.1 hypothetical protein [Clostridia bacterium]